MVFSVIPLLGGRNTTKIICIVHVIYIVSTPSEGSQQHLLIKRLYKKCSKEFSKCRKKLDSNTGTTERVGASNVNFAIT